MDARQLMQQADNERIKAESTRRQAGQLERSAEGKDNPDAAVAIKHDADKLFAEASQHEQLSEQLRHQAFSQQDEADKLKEQKAALEKQLSELDKQITDLEGGKIGLL